MDENNRMVIEVIRNGERVGVDMDIDFTETTYRQRDFKDFAEQVLRPAFWQLFPETEGD
jgi:hypothetical protein